MLTITIIAVVIAVAASSTAAFLYGQNEMLIIRLLESRRRELRAKREGQLLLDKLFAKAGIAPMRARSALNPPPPSTGMARKFVSPSEAIRREQQKRDGIVETGPEPPTIPDIGTVPQVPPAIASSFLKDAGAVVANR